MFAAELCYNRAMKIKKLKVNIGKLSLVLIALCAVLIAADLILKWCEEEFAWNFEVIPGLIWVESGHRNDGAAFSSFAGAQPFLITITFIMLAALVAAFILLPERFPLLKLAIAMVVAGAIGNLVDRLMFLEVRDFVWVNMLFSTACCNFADFWIVFAVIIAVVDLLFLNEWAVFPLTKRAKEAQAKREEIEKQRTAEGGDGALQNDADDEPNRRE